MKSVARHFAQVKRTFPIFPQIESIGYVPSKVDVVKRCFSGYNFSFILSGEGFYYYNNEKIMVKAPCVLLQWPNTPMRYGANVIDGKGWEELYLVYPASEGDKLINSKVFNKEEQVVREFTKNSHFDVVLKKFFMKVLENPQDNSLSITEIDNMCWELIVASFDAESNYIKNDKVLKEVRSYLEKDLAKDIMLDELAKKVNMSLSTLRRYWKKYYPKENFNDYRNRIFVQESAKLLIETSYDIKSIAELLGFDDPHYFSRKFHKIVGITATDYRKEYRVR